MHMRENSSIVTSILNRYGGASSFLVEARQEINEALPIGLDALQ
jgi:hypothetical protein